ncbi:MAG: hypothetical protein A2928_03665 [Candidatus Taylorbacteria bacterium RIFCSPLOWO2_01_FULL_45_15b]|uniref:Uncharacterized protein n=1 Tax=Candidatus Taylorbacteria bacterium RIFCSPLOWO2_01_FULL_45_15b TaxID=1802319 RepID=A0A1G2NH86_9BACT|nr:MAG: hypothetical protein A2928_03665 [Candidatus Taylorbacteria bacterium RIFCSPLOWO2_01_FULL_45_15b]
MENRIPQRCFAYKRNREGRAASFASVDEQKLVADSPYPHNNERSEYIMCGRAGELLHLRGESNSGVVFFQ